MNVKAVTGLSISIGDGMEVTLSAADWEAEGHLWSIERRPITVDQLVAVARILGPDAEQGVMRRLDAEVVRAKGIAVSLESRVAAAAAAVERFDELTAVRTRLAASHD
jgi:hypothetical protein